MDLDELIVHRDISTSGPTPGEFEAVLRDRATDDGVCLLTISATMSSTYEAAVLGAELVGRELGADRVRVVDTRDGRGCAGAGRASRPRARRARGATLDEVEAVARAAMNEVRLVACVPDLGYLVRSGRVPNIAGGPGAGSGSRRCSSSARPAPIRCVRRGAWTTRSSGWSRAAGARTPTVTGCRSPSCMRTHSTPRRIC